MKGSKIVVKGRWGVVICTGAPLTHPVFASLDRPLSSPVAERGRGCTF